MEVDTQQFRMADRLTEGQLTAILTAHRTNGRSYEEISRRLWAEHGIEVTRQTVARWGKLLGLDEKQSA